MQPPITPRPACRLDLPPAAPTRPRNSCATAGALALLAMTLLAAPPVQADEQRPAAASNERVTELRAASPSTPSAPVERDNAPATPATPSPSPALDELINRMAGASPRQEADDASQPLADASADAPERDQPLLDPQAMEAQPLGSSGQAPAGAATDGSWMLNTLGALALVIGLILVMRWAWQKLGGQVAAGGSSPVVEVLSRTAVAPRNHVLLIRVNHRVLVVGDSSAGLRTLTTVDDPEEVADLLQATSAGQRRSFDRTLDRFDAQHDAELGGDDSEHRIDRARDSVSSLLARLRTVGGRGGAT